ncbi:MAG: hypothetical protein IJP92_00045 [Lachnospiraceae bacterium]|nr:hypothetical protein [Lachnospiraceae bacterium]
MIPSGKPIASGQDVLPYLAREYRQLYLSPGEEGKQHYEQVVRGGKKPPGESLSHFHMDERDVIDMEQTPAGSVLLTVLHDRRDFETFLQIMTGKCVPYEVPATQGAAIIDGVINWNRINAHKDAWFAEEMAKGNLLPDWGEEMKRFTSVKSNYLDAIILLSSGPYSGIPAKEAGFGEKEWLDASLQIRKYHECTHFVCRRLFPEKKDVIWDELVADAEGIFDTFGRFDLQMEELFLGINETGYTGGRLANYADSREEDLDELAKKCHRTLLRFAEAADALGKMKPFALAVWLEERKEALSCL